ncbi:hypothetical protein BU24DRAFT_452812 [Aaosphaeria arxii CBS 175.79]|uniref:Extracellular membrane protein CFEM domain-containing protein n=1 Tax=Aaosphaeria arxii CBS 175.79 TaxID=1450172 RepID=A0A6A5XNW3_9PLEO|nr:uncharacterized protein BU24DRAFT_452812 [Aaosphaeria arxii CBS 175.79]KAF2014044.1 hypothetical protein BU24DRAFT_452812 [Aaosphaeria arxii CBS 175.79]
MYLFILLSICLAGVIAQGADQVTLSASIKSRADYSLLPKCVNQCLWDIGDNDTNDIGGDLAIHLSCGSPWINGCYCRGASAATAFSFITSCASYLCTTPKASDINSAVGVYTGYCSSALGDAYKPEAIPQSMPEDGQSTAAGAAPTTVAGGVSPAAGSTSSIPAQTGSKSPSSTSGSGNPSTPKDKDDGKIAGLSKGAFIGVVISASCSVLGLLFGVGFKVYKHKKQGRLQQRQTVTELNYGTKA